MWDSLVTLTQRFKVTPIEHLIVCLPRMGSLRTSSWKLFNRTTPKLLWKKMCATASFANVIIFHVRWDNKAIQCTDTPLGICSGNQLLAVIRLCKELKRLGLPHPL
ncbi:hypothetical protein M514_02797 [Trichuris suis]|uniref:Uncharacterized protein n=1 Tax=Trichuris suis TaxID=68888 RepID=A0A085N2T7_9BILA|nr:hypothetical protein M513_02797 [Trichuris suis]KFD63783.1 hypothetical protein M514_02797 [Trichuris suis]